MIHYIPFRFPGLKNVECIFTTRVGGVSEGHFYSGNLSFDVGDMDTNVKSNREDLLSSFGLSEILEVRQVHGDNIVVVDIDHDRDIEADAMITSRENRVLFIKTADCQPILIAHISGKFIGAFHVGWRANRGRFILKWVEIFCREYDISPEDILAVRGPSLCPVHSEFVNFINEFGEDFEQYYDSRNKTMNLWKLTKDQLIEAGLLRKNIFSIDLCTYCMEELFFSYRRDKRCGRQGSFIWIRC